MKLYNQQIVHFAIIISAFSAAINIQSYNCQINNNTTLPNYFTNDTYRDNKSIINGNEKQLRSGGVMNLSAKAKLNYSKLEDNRNNKLNIKMSLENQSSDSINHPVESTIEKLIVRSNKSETIRTIPENSISNGNKTKTVTSSNVTKTLAQNISENRETVKETTMKPTTESPLTPLEVCLKKQKSGLYPTIPRDQFCSRYIYCIHIYGKIKAIEYRCSKGTFYNTESEECTFVRPRNCN